MNLDLVDCSEEYWDLVLSLRNSENGKNTFLVNLDIDDESHLKYMNIHSNDYKIILIDGEFGGYVGVVDMDFRICIVDKFRRLGVGSFALSVMMEKYPDKFINIRVREDNHVSRRFFNRNGFYEAFKTIDVETKIPIIIFNSL